MMRIRVCRFITLPIVLSLLVLTGCSPRPDDASSTAVNRIPSLFPDYTGLVIPLNIAPLNFLIQESGSRYFVRIKADNGQYIEISSRTPSIRISQKAWSRILSVPGVITFDTYVFSDNVWRKFKSFTDTVVSESVDPYVVYGKTDAGSIGMIKGIFQRCTETFDENPLITTDNVPSACMSYQSFRRNNPEKMALQLQCRTWGTPMLLSFADTSGLKSTSSAISMKTACSSGKVGFSAWHPSQDVIAFSTNKFGVVFHTASPEMYDVVDPSSDILLYKVTTGTIVCNPDIASPARIETMPEWSPDGSYLYYCSAPNLLSAQHTFVTYDLMRIAYDVKTGTWGKPETVVTAQQAGGSITQPRFSPDGSKLLVTVSLYGDFPVYQRKSNMYLLDVASRAFTQLGFSGNCCDAWHCWSSNGRWISFGSNRMDGSFSRIYFSYVFPDGHNSKPFVLPQKNPRYYRKLVLTYNLPEQVTGPVLAKGRTMAEALDTIRQAVDEK